MKRIALVFFTTALVCLALAGLRVAVLDLLTAPPGELLSPRSVSDPEPPPPSLPVDSIAGRAAGAAAPSRLEPPAMIWGSALRPTTRDAALR